MHEGWLEMIRQPELDGGTLNDVGYLPIMNMADVREQVMFYLKVQAAHKPIDERIVA